MMPSRTRYFLVLGLDYGTSYSKIVIREVNQKQASTVTDREGRYLFPSVFGYKDDCLYTPMCNPCPNAVAFLKMQAPGIALNQYDDNAIPTSLFNLIQTGDKAKRIRSLLAWQFCGFLATALDYLKNRSPWPDYDPARDHLFINLGLPMEHLEHQSSKVLFLGALAAARDLALMHDFPADGITRVDLDEWEDACNQSEWPPSDPAKDVLFLYPEVAAGVQSVMRSPTANDGLYITLDVGSGTLDANSFRRLTKSYDGNEPANKLSYYAARVSPLGISQLDNQAGHHIFEGLPHLVDAIANDYSRQQLVPPAFFIKVNQEIEALKAQSLLKCPNHSVCVNNATKPNKPWDSCRIYGFGGGMYQQEYRQNLETKLQSWIDDANIINLPTPTDLAIPNRADFSRLAIAYGLSFPKENLEEIVPPAENPDRPRPPRHSNRPENPGDPGFWTLD